MAPSHYLNQWWNIVNWTFRNKLQWNFNQNFNIFIEENTFQNVVCAMSAILSVFPVIYHYMAYRTALNSGKCWSVWPNKKLPIPCHQGRAMGCLQSVFGEYWLSYNGTTPYFECTYPWRRIVCLLEHFSGKLQLPLHAVRQVLPAPITPLRQVGAPAAWWVWPSRVRWREGGGSGGCVLAGGGGGERREADGGRGALAKLTLETKTWRMLTLYVLNFSEGA